MIRPVILTLLALVLTAGSTSAQPAGKPRLAPPPAVPLFDNLGAHHHAITATPLAQRYFDQGLRLVYAFNHDEAIAAFRTAAQLDTTCAMCWWGIALALGPNINVPMDSAQLAPALDAVRAARARAAHASPGERAYIDAVALRYSPDPKARRGALDSAYARAMGEVARRDPDDADAATLYAEALLDLRPWDYYAADGTPRPGTAEVVSVLEGVLRRVPNHPGACHYYIHAVEASARPDRALPCADRLASLMPGAGHLVHMPAHIYMRVGRYADAVAANRHALHADRSLIDRRHPEGLYPLLYPAHNAHFLWSAATMAGESAVALQAAREAGEAVPLDVIRQNPPFEFILPTPYVALARFGRWEELLREPAPPEDLRYTTGLWHYARGLAYAATDRPDSARAERTALAAIAAATPADRVVSLNSAATLLRLATNALDGELAARQGDAAAAVRSLTAAVQLQDGLTYDEPPGWYYPVRQSLGAVLLRAGQAKEAEAVYREDLRRNPENGWSLFGLARSLRAQGRASDAAAVDARFARAWAQADVKLEESRF
jgi:tetratricopeptide (TPR) repeat protein